MFNLFKNASRACGDGAVEYNHVDLSSNLRTCLLFDCFVVVAFLKINLSGVWYILVTLAVAQDRGIPVRPCLRKQSGEKQDGHQGNGACRSLATPEFDPWNLHKGRRGGLTVHTLTHVTP